MTLTGWISLAVGFTFLAVAFRFIYWLDSKVWNKLTKKGK